ncbi:hypothetical protein RI367_002081 [Sorochytrium milnesiophthora]
MPVAADVARIRKEIARQAQHAILVQFPAKLVNIHDTVLSCNNDLRSAPVDMQVLDAGEMVESKSKKRKTDATSEHTLDDSDHTEPAAQITAMTRTITAEMATFAELCNVIKAWIQLETASPSKSSSSAATNGKVPRPDMVTELSRAEDAAFSVMEMATKYYATRADLVNKMSTARTARNDYRLDELDAKHYHQLKMTAADLRNNYAVLYETLGSNL